MPAQLTLGLRGSRRPKKRPTRGGARVGAGRPRVRPLPEGWDPGRKFMPHLRRATINRHRPAHVTVRLCRLVRSLRNGKFHRVVADGILGMRGRPGFRVVHYSVQGDHVHLVVEADSRPALGQGMKGLNVRIARRFNRAVGGRKGRVVADRYHARVLGTPTEVKRALLYVLNNARHHAAQARATYPAAWLDPYSSAATFDGWRWRDDSPAPPGAAPPPTCTSPAKGWLLTTGWRRRGLLDPGAVPGSTPAPAFHG